jgi:acyl-CoA reductase-like NAD-dependent aldehyde dehydrogenase
MGHLHKNRVKTGHVCMKVEKFDIATVDDCLDTLEAAFQSDMWKQLPEHDRRHLVNRLYIILRDIGEGSGAK